MEISINKTKKSKLTSIIVIVLMMTSIMLIAVPLVLVVNGAEVGIAGPLPAGKTPAVNTQTVCSLSVRPRLVGLGQSVLVNAWLCPATQNVRNVRGYLFTFTKPDGTTTTFTTDSENATAAIWFDYPVDMVGQWKVKVDFPGTYFNGTTDEATQSAYYQPSSSKEVTFTCQQDYNPSWPAEALPTDYWTRPVDFSHRDWWPILGNYPANGYDGTTDPQWSTRYPDTNPLWSSQYGLIPWVQGPRSSHIVWKEINNPAGIVGGQMGQEGNTIASDLSTSPYLCNLVYGGRGYRMVAKPVLTNTSWLMPTSPNTWQCFDLRTGQVYWEQTGITQAPTFIEYTVSTTTAAISAGAVTESLVYLSVSQNQSANQGTFRLIKYNPVTGAVINNGNISMTVTPTISITTYYKNGYVLSVQDLGAAAANTTAGRYRLINWTTLGTSTNFGTRVASNTSYAMGSLPSVIDWSTGYGASASGRTVANVYIGVNVTGYNLWTGQTIWNTYIDQASLFSGSCTVADHGKVAFSLSRLGDSYGRYVAYDLATGNKAWESEIMPYPWSSTGFGAYGVASAYGLIFHPGYAGITAINWTNGKIVWNYHKYSQAPFESPYTDENGTEVFAFNSGLRVADGMVYGYNCEHTTTFPR
ncbi:MAG TPA: PQQ-binding-like beta-propeller repeat protein, partial [Candidatus Sulfotelmatobacter sp.]|nr:PQQ-binding-like beta-propeller repeat protein [Candidatus Sulfotelmatobacter sp.]